LTSEAVSPERDRACLPGDFVWGVATAAYQIEGAVTEGGRGPSIWDTFSHTPGATLHGDTGDVACDHYHRWESDLDLMAELGIPAYRLSLSWARLQPGGSGPLNPEGVAFYRNLLRGMADRGITPYVTLYHWDLPQALQDAGGWPARATAERFGEYSALVADALGDLAEHWITINEPICASFLSYSLGMQAPGLRDTGLAVRAAHHLLLAHGLALRAFREHRPKARLGITNLVGNLTPATDSADDLAAARAWDARSNRVFLDPVYLGRYSQAVLDTLGRYGLAAEELPGTLVQPGDLEIISAPTDFAGINHYTNMIVRADPTAPDGVAASHVEPAPTSFGWSDTPDALTRVLLGWLRTTRGCRST
jgi:beta-glucosidase